MLRLHLAVCLPCLLSACAGPPAPPLWRSSISLEHGSAQLQAAARLLPAQQNILPDPAAPAPPTGADDAPLPRLAGALLLKRLSIQSEGQTLASVLEQISRASGLRFALSPDVKAQQPLHVQVRSSALEEILPPLLQSAGLEGHAISDNQMLLYPASVEARKHYAPLLLRSFALNHSDGAALVKQLQTLLPGVTPVFDARSNLLRMRASPQQLDSAQNIINALEQPASGIELELSLYEVNSANLLQLGLQAPASLSLQTGAPAWRSGPLQLQALELSVQAAQTLQQSRLLQRSLVRLQAQQSARIHFGDQLSNPSGDGAGARQTLSSGLNIQAQAQFIGRTESRLQLQFEYSAPTLEFNSPNGSTVWRLQSSSVHSAFTLPHGTQQILAHMQQYAISQRLQQLPSPGVQRNPQQARQLLLVLHSRQIGV